MLRLLLIGLLAFGAPALMWAQDKDKDTKDKDVKAVDPPKDKDATDPPKDPQKAKDAPAAAASVAPASTPWHQKLSFSLVVLGVMTVIAILLALNVSQISSLRASIDKLAEKMGS